MIINQSIDYYKFLNSKFRNNHIQQLLYINMYEHNRKLIATTGIALLSFFVTSCHPKFSNME